jgi:hypothetical protein
VTTKNLDVYIEERPEYIGVDLGHQLSVFVNADYITSTVVYEPRSLLNEIALGS